MSSLSKRMVALAAFVLVVAVAFVFSAQKARSAFAAPKPTAKRALKAATTVTGTLTGLFYDPETDSRVEHTIDLAEDEPTKQYGVLPGKTYILDLTVTNAGGLRTAAFGSIETDNVFHIVTSPTPVNTLRFQNVSVTAEEFMEGNCGVASTSVLLPNAATMTAVAQEGSTKPLPNLPAVPERGSCNGYNWGEPTLSSRIIPGQNAVTACPGPTTVSAAATTGWQVHQSNPNDEPNEDAGACTDILPASPPQNDVILSHTVTNRKNVNVHWTQPILIRERKLYVRYIRQADKGVLWQRRLTIKVELRGTPQLVTTPGDACPADPGPADPSSPIP